MRAWSVIVVALTVVFCNQPTLCRAWAQYQTMDRSECASIVIPARFYSVAEAPERTSTAVIESERRCDTPVAPSRMRCHEISKGTGQAFVLPCDSSRRRILGRRSH